MKKMIEELLRKVFGEVLGAESLSKVLMAVVEKVLAENQEWVKAIAGKVKAIADEQAAQEAARPESEDDDAGEPSEVQDGEPTLSWSYGGFNGSMATVSADAVLESATLKGDTLTFAWAKGDCRNIGATSKTDAGHTVACLFVEEAGGGAVGGKFEWISTSRKTRSVKNIREDGYNGWPKVALDDGDGKLWFCIAGVKDDKKTSNGKRTACVEVERL